MRYFNFVCITFRAKNESPESKNHSPCKLFVCNSLRDAFFAIKVTQTKLKTPHLLKKKKPAVIFK